MLDLTMLAFELTLKYRNPVILLADGYLGQMTGKIDLPPYYVKPGVPAWAVTGDRAHRRNLISSIFLSETDLEAHNHHLLAKYAEIERDQARAERYRTQDADVLLIACNTPARMAKGAVETLRARGIRAGLFRPVTLWPFPIRPLLPLVEQAQRIVVVEALSRSGRLRVMIRTPPSFSISSSSDMCAINPRPVPSAGPSSAPRFRRGLQALRDTAAAACPCSAARWSRSNGPIPRRAG